MTEEIEGYWDIVITSLQDIFNRNELSSLDNRFEEQLANGLDTLSQKDLEKLKDDVMEHEANVGTARRLLSTSQSNLDILLEHLRKEESQSAQRGPSNENVGTGTRSSKANNKKANNKKIGRLYYASKFNPLEPIYVGSEVAYKLRNKHFEEWIQCEVIKIMGDGNKFEIRDPEPDENNNPGQTFRATSKEILLIPPQDEVGNLANYPPGTKVLARYPETTTFYPAVVAGTKKGGVVRLRFDGEEEVNKETEAERRLVLPFPER